jgi:UTP--glucose-1-phosphate uridylyltransferase
MPVRKVVIPAAGLGTRFLPATKSQAKEMIPIVDKPGIQYAVEEAVRAGLDDVLIITARGKSSLEDHFDRSLELEERLERDGKTAELEEIKRIANLAKVHYVRQKEARGFGDAVLAAREHVGEEPCVVMVPDEIVPEPAGDELPLLSRMLEVFEERRASVIAVQEVPHQDISSYGAIDPEPLEGNVVRIKDMVEKPALDEAPSDLASRGRYVFTPDIFEAIAKTAQGVGGEIQLTDAIRALARGEGVYAYVYDGPIYDVGNKLSFLKATIELALRRDDLSGALKEWLVDRVARLR